VSARGLGLAATVALLVAAELAPVTGTANQAATRTIRVPQDVATLQAAVDASAPGDLILLDRGTYPGGIVVPEGKPGITIRGVDRNEVVFDGRDIDVNAIDIDADDVVLENMSAHNFTGNGFYWDGVDGFAGRYLTVWNVNLYGIYAIQSRNGVFEQSLVSGAADAAFYIGECNPCDTVLRSLVARYSAIGYSGTNAGGNLEIRDSIWELNGTGILPNSFNDQPAPPPQRDSIIAGNVIRDSGTVPVPANSPLAGWVGLGIGIAGGHENLVEDNEITGSDRYGIALFATLQRDRSQWLPDANEIRGNTVTGSGIADLAMAEGSRIPNCFGGNEFGSSLPADIETVMPCDGQPTADGHPRVTEDLSIPIPLALEQLGQRPRYQDMPVPEPQPNMPGIEAPAVPAVSPGASSSPGSASPAGSASASPEEASPSPPSTAEVGSGSDTAATPANSPDADGAGAATAGLPTGLLAVTLVVVIGAAVIGWLAWRRRSHTIVE
jgi:hypothetical protein